MNYVRLDHPLTNTVTDTQQIIYFPFGKVMVVPSSIAIPKLRELEIAGTYKD